MVKWNSAVGVYRFVPRWRRRERPTLETADFHDSFIRQCLNFGGKAAGRRPSSKTLGAELSLTRVSEMQTLHVQSTPKMVHKATGDEHVEF